MKKRNKFRGIITYNDIRIKVPRREGEYEPSTRGSLGGALEKILHTLESRHPGIDDAPVC